MLENPRTTFGGLMALATVIGLLAHWIDLATAVALLGIAGAWVGITGKDSK